MTWSGERKWRFPLHLSVLFLRGGEVLSLPNQNRKDGYFTQIIWKARCDLDRFREGMASGRCARGRARRKRAVTAFDTGPPTPRQSAADRVWRHRRLRERKLPQRLAFENTRFKHGTLSGRSDGSYRGRRVGWSSSGGLCAPPTPCQIVSKGFKTFQNCVGS